jgi:hypothetical protein
MKTFYFLLVTILLFFIGCKSDFSHGKKAEKAISSSYVLFNQAGLKPLEITSMRNSAAEVLKLRKKEGGNKSYAFIDKDIWIFGGFVSDAKSLFQDSLNGTWIDFKEDLTYTYGSYDQVGGSGQYFYDFEKFNLLMLDDNTAIKPQEFEVKTGNDIIVLVGSFIYKDNNIQAKLDRGASFPQKKSSVNPK